MNNHKVSIEDFVTVCEICFSEMGKDFSKEAETEVRCWYDQEISGSKEKACNTARKLAEQWR